jgi:MtN3 and saliva related transmembrane protein
MLVYSIIPYDICILRTKMSDEDDIIADTFGYVAGSCAVIISLPQIIKVIKTKKADDLSAWTILLLMLTSALYIVYGFLIDSTPLIVTDSVALLLGTILLILKFFFDWKNSNSSDSSDSSSDSSLHV